MLLFDRGATPSAALLLAFAIAGKLYPGVFVLYLLLPRDWRGSGWNAVWTTAQTVLTFVMLASVLRQLREPATSDARRSALNQALPA